MTTAEEYFNKGCELFEAGEYEDAIENFSKSIGLDPCNESIYCNRGSCYYEIQQYQKAFKDYTKAIELDPDLCETYYNRGNCYFKFKQYEYAIDDYTKAIKLGFYSEEIYSKRGWCYYFFKQYEDAIEDYSKTIELNPDYSEAYYNRGLCYSALQQYEDAIEDYTKYIEVNPDEDGYFDRAFCYFSIGQYENAIEDYAEAIKLNSCNHKAYFGIGQCYFGLNQYDEAIKLFSKIIDSCHEGDEIYLKARLNRMKCYAITKNYINAIEDCEHILNNETRLYQFADKSIFDIVKLSNERLKETAKHEILTNMRVKNHIMCAITAFINDPQSFGAEIFQAYAISAETTIEHLKEHIDNPKFPNDIKEVFVELINNQLKVFDEATSGMSEEEKNKVIEQMFNAQLENNQNIDFSQLHYNPTQGRKLDF